MFADPPKRTPQVGVGGRIGGQPQNQRFAVGGLVRGCGLLGLASGTHWSATDHGSPIAITLVCPRQRLLSDTWVRPPSLLGQQTT